MPLNFCVYIFLFVQTAKLSPVRHSKPLSHMPAPPPPPPPKDNKVQADGFKNNNINNAINYSNINRETSVSRLPPPPPANLTLVTQNSSESNIISPQMPSPPITNGNSGGSMFPSHVVGGPPLPPPIDDLEIPSNKFADLTLSRPKKKPQQQENVQHSPSMFAGKKSPTTSIGSSGGGNDARSNLLAEIRKGKQLQKW